MSIRTDGAYNLTRRRGTTGTITRVTGHTADPETGAQTPTEVTTTIRWMFKQPTNYIRLYRAEATQQRVGDVTFIIWLPDVEATFTELRQEDYITFNSKRYEVVSSSVEDNAFVITAKEFA